MSEDRWDTFRSTGALGWQTSSLFADVHDDKEIAANAPFWLERDKTGNGRPVFRTWFLHLEDLSGNKLATKLLGSQQHWDLMYSRSPWFKEAVDRWCHELKATLRSRAMDKVMEIMKDGGPTGLSAAKFVVSELRTEQKPVRGRPSKEEVKGNLKHLTASFAETEQDFERISAILDDKGNLN